MAVLYLYSEIIFDRWLVHVTRLHTNGNFDNDGRVIEFRRWASLVLRPSEAENN